MYRRYARRVANQYGIPKNIFFALIGQESGWNPNAVSPAGAIGLGQLMPATAQGLGVDPHNPKQNLAGAAKYLAGQYERFGNWRQALAAYNAGPGAVESGDWLNYPETTNYVKSILGSAGKVRGGLSPRVASQRLTAPSGGIDKRTLALQNLAQIASGQPIDFLSSLSDLAIERETGGQKVRGGGQAPSGGKINVGKWVSLASGADREGVSTKRPILRFAARIARLYGSPLTIGTGTNHSQYTVDGNVSAHWTGNAVDIPATGADLRRLGFDALRAAGVSRKKARAMAAQGGLFNVGGYQIIFLTNEGGNHFNHLHIGIRS